jgi:hypothetical protein
MLMKHSTICLYLLLLLTSLSCSTSNQSQYVNDSSSTNLTVENRIESKDYSNKPVNLNNPKDKIKFDKQIEELNQNRELWASQNIQNYDFICQFWGGAMDYWSPALIKVRDNKRVSMEQIEKLGNHKLDEYEKTDTVEKMFDYIQRSLEESRSVNTKYDSKYGFPKRIGVRFSLAIDANVALEIQKFEVIKDKSENN